MRPNVVINGAEDWNRTSDTSIFSAVLYRLSYLGTALRLAAEPQSYQWSRAADKTARPMSSGENAGLHEQLRRLTVGRSQRAPGKRWDLYGSPRAR